MSTKQKGVALRAAAVVALAAMAGFAVATLGAGAQAQQQNQPQAGAHAHGPGHDHAHGPAEQKEVRKAVAVLSPASGSNVSGTITFTQAQNGVRVVAEIRGLDANGIHGFHVHEFGDCTAEDATSAGGHFNPTGHPHGGPMDEERHAGDMGNLEADAQGVARLDYTDTMMQLMGPESIVGHAVIVHAKADDLKTQPTGDAGGRIACGVIGVANTNE